MAENKDSIPLSYARPGAAADRRIRRQGQLRLCLICVILLNLVLLGYRYVPTAWSRIQFLYLQRQWATCTMPPGQVIFDTQLQSPIHTDSFSREAVADMIGYDPPCRRTFPQPPSSGTIFLHKLQSPSGNERIVCIDVEGYDVVYPDRRSRLIRLQITVRRPQYKPDGRIGGGGRWYINCRSADRLRFFAGQLDPKDPARITIPYEHNGVTGTIDAYLQNNDTIKIVPDRGTGGGPDFRTGWSPLPATQPSTRGSP